MVCIYLPVLKDYTSSLASKYSYSLLQAWEPIDETSSAYTIRLCRNLLTLTTSKPPNPDVIMFLTFLVIFSLGSSLHGPTSCNRE
jgi:hypothetical protein